MPKGLVRLTGLETLDYFVVSKIDSVCGLSDLSHFDNISGELEIRLVDRSKDIISEAKAANLHKKEKITGFRIDCCGSTEEDEMVFDNLKPGANLEYLKIYNYAGKQLACWMREGIHSWLPNLVDVELSDCNGCIYLCSFGRLPHLRWLRLMNMDKVEYIEKGSSRNNDNTIGLVDELSSTPLFPFLEYLELINMPKLKGWWSVTECVQDQDRGLNQLQKWIPAFPKLEIVVMGMELLISMVNVFPQVFDSLRNLSVNGHHIETAEQLGILFKNHIPVFRGMSSLERLSIHDCKWLEAIPDWIDSLTSLTSLTINSCKCLEAIPDWIDSLTSLTSLNIRNCPRLKSLPSQISNLKNLKSLTITHCSCEFAKRCLEPTGEDWPKIQHILNVSILPIHPFYRDGKIWS